MSSQLPVGDADCTRVRVPPVAMSSVRTIHEDHSGLCSTRRVLPSSLTSPPSTGSCATSAHPRVPQTTRSQPSTKVLLRCRSRFHRPATLRKQTSTSTIRSRRSTHRQPGCELRLRGVCGMIPRPLVPHAGPAGWDWCASSNPDRVDCRAPELYQRTGSVPQCQIGIHGSGCSW